MRREVAGHLLSSVATEIELRDPKIGALFVAGTEMVQEMLETGNLINPTAEIPNTIDVFLTPGFGDQLKTCSFE